MHQIRYWPHTTHTSNSVLLSVFLYLHQNYIKILKKKESPDRSHWICNTVFQTHEETTKQEPQSCSGEEEKRKKISLQFMKEKLENNIFPGQKKSRLKKSAVQVEPCAFPQW